MRPRSPRTSELLVSMLVVRSQPALRHDKETYVKLKSRIIGVSAGVVLTVGMAAGTAFAGAPVVATGETAYSQGTMASRGGCSTIAIGTILDATKTSGLGLTEQALTSSSKGSPRNAGDAAALRVGQCSLEKRLGITGTPVNVFGKDIVFKDVSKFGTKLTSVATDCNSIEGTDLDERPLAGKMSVGFSDLTKLDAYIRVQGFDTALADVVWLTGIVAKGEAVGATIGGNVWFNPAYKSKTATTTTYYGTAIADDPKTLTFNEAGTAIAPGYGTSALFTIGEAVGCSDGVTPVGTGYGVPGLDLIGLGGGAGFPSLGLGSTADGIQFLI